MGGSHDEGAPGAHSSWRGRLNRSVLGVAMLLCFGVLGLLLWLLPALHRRRRERSASCTACRRRQRVSRVVVAGLGVLLLVGAGVRTQAASRVVDECSMRFTTGAEEVVAETPTPDSAPGLWGRARTVVNAPISGVMLMGTKVAGMDHCSGSAVLVAFPPTPTADGGGSVVGDVFVSWLSEVDGVALPGQETYVRFDSGANAKPEVVEAIARHESRHVDQWAIATVLGGPMALPTAYYVDSLFFPLARNHFERAAGLEDGGYDVPPDFGPRPLWLPLAASVGLLLLVLRRRIRWWSRVLVGDRADARVAHEDGRCPLHSRGWFGSGPPHLHPERSDDGS